MYIYILEFIFLFFISALNSFKYKNTLWVVLIVFLVLFFLAAFRGGYIDRDYFSYYNKFQEFPTIGNYFEKSYKYYEPSFYFIPLLCKYLTDNYYVQLSFATFAFLGVALKLNAITYSNSFFLSILVYISHWFILHEMTQIRAGVATGFILFSIRYIYKKDLVKFLLTICFACFFHYSALLFVFAYFLSGKSIHKFLYGFLLVVCLFFALLKIDFLNFLNSLITIPKLQEYQMLMKVGMYDEINIFNVAFLLNYFITAIILLTINTIYKYNPYAFILIKLNVIGISIYIMFSAVPVLSMRVSELFLVTQIALFPCIIYSFSKKVYGYLLIILYSIAIFYINTFHNFLLQDYQTWF